MTTFKELGISELTLQAIHQMGFEETTPIQRDTIPLGLEGVDLIGQAQTGTGKTAAFGIPLVERVDTKKSYIQGIVVAPTRELAIQVAEELNKIGQPKGVRSIPIYGGQEIGRQIRSLQKKPHVIVGTPGRLMDHMRRKTIRLQQIETVILDEADEMLNMGFIEDIETILKEVPAERHTMLFSATMPRPIQMLAQKFMKEPKIIRVQAKEVTVPNIEQQYMEVPERKKFDVLCNLLDMESPDLAIIFGRTKRRVDELSEALNKRGYSAEGIHGDLTQRNRDTVMRKFKQGSVDILVATDVAARGLDISNVSHIFNFDIPQDPESYVHRIGRTGRAGHKGVAITFVTPREIGQLKNIESTIKRKMDRHPIPSIHEAREGQQRIAMDKLLEVAEKQDVAAYRRLAEELMNEHDSVTLLSAALKLMTKEPSTEPIRLTEEAPLRSKRPQGKNFRGGYRGGQGGRSGQDQRGGQRGGGRTSKRSRGNR